MSSPSRFDDAVKEELKEEDVSVRSEGGDEEADEIYFNNTRHEKLESSIYNMDAAYDPLFPNVYMRCWKYIRKNCIKRSDVRINQVEQQMFNELKNREKERLIKEIQEGLRRKEEAEAEALRVQKEIFLSNVYTERDDLHCERQQHFQHMQPALNDDFQDESSNISRILDTLGTPSPVVHLEWLPNPRLMNLYELQCDIMMRFSSKFPGLYHVAIFEQTRDHGLNFVQAYLYFDNMGSSISVACDMFEKRIGNCTIISSFYHENPSGRFTVEEVLKQF